MKINGRHDKKRTARTGKAAIAAIAAATAQSQGVKKRENEFPAGIGPGGEMDRPLRELAELAIRFPFRWFPQIKVARICGFGADVMTTLAEHGAPILARRCNPHLLHKWLEKNVRTIGKIRAAKGASQRPPAATGRGLGVRRGGGV